VTQFVKIQIPVDEATARGLTDMHRLEAVGRLVDRIVRPITGDPLATLLEATEAEARSAGLTDEEIRAELATYNAERRV
jgi:hypothetical protein